jgi:nucleotide-binding universal stress UspA family protein
MTEIARILCPIDFSDVSRRALDHAVAIARWYQAEILALHVLEPVLMPPPPVFLAARPPSVLAPENRHEMADSQLRRYLETAGCSGIKTLTVVDEGHPASCILKHAAAMPADVIAMGTHGVSGFDRLVLGSVAEKVLRKASCPVLTVPPAAVGAGRIPYTRLLCPVDFSDSSLAALRVATSLAEEADAHLTILHVLYWSAEELFVSEQPNPPEFLRTLEGQARDRLEALVTREMSTWCKPVTRVAFGKPHRRILEAAESDASDLIVIGVRGRNAIDRTVFGSTTNQVIRHAGCPVLTIRTN